MLSILFTWKVWVWSSLESEEPEEDSVMDGVGVVAGPGGGATGRGKLGGDGTGKLGGDKRGLELIMFRGTMHALLQVVMGI